LFVSILAAVLLLIGHLFHSDHRHFYAGRVNVTLIDALGDVLLPVKPLVVWNINFHSAPVHDLTTLLHPLGVQFINKDVSTKYCQQFNTCSAGSNVRVINSDNILALKYYKASQHFLFRRVS